MSSARRQAPLPSPTSPLAPPGQPVLKPSGSGLSFGGRKEEPQVSELETPDGEPVVARDRDATGSAKAADRQPRNRVRPAPRVADAVALTVRFEPKESLEVDFLMLELKEEIGATKLDKSEVVRELLRLAREHNGVRQTLVRRLSRTQGTLTAPRRTTPES